MNITVLPPQFPPIQPTVRTVSKNLKEHFILFLNANNLNGYADDPDRVIDDTTIAGILLTVAASEGIHDKVYRNYAFRIRDLSNRAITHCQGYEMLAKALGYRTHLLSYLCRSELGYRVNVWDGYENAHDSIFNLDTLYLNGKNPKITALLEKNREMNISKQNKNAIKELRKS